MIRDSLFQDPKWWNIHNCVYNDQFNSGSNASLMGGAKQLIHKEVEGANLGQGVIRWEWGKWTIWDTHKVREDKERSWDSGEEKCFVYLFPFCKHWQHNGKTMIWKQVIII